MEMGGEEGAGLYFGVNVLNHGLGDGHTIEGAGTPAQFI